MICDKCNGTGEPNNNEIDYNKRFFYIPPKHCDKCHGSGKLDWIENVVGKKPPEIINTIDYSTISNLSGTGVSIDQDIKQEIIDDVVKQMTIKIDEKMTKLLEGYIKGGKI